MTARLMVLVCATLCLGAARAQGWTPARNVEIVVPSAPGGTNDKLARQVERTLGDAKAVNAAITVVHRSGAGGQLAYQYANSRAGDPHVLLITAPTLLAANITGTSKLNFSDFTPLASIFNDHMVFAVNAGSAIRSGKEFAARMRTDASSMAFGFTSALGNHHHIAAGLFMKSIGANARDLKPVVFKGSAEAVTSLLGNHIEFVSTGAANALPHAAGGKLRILGVSAPRRMPGAMAGVPTWQEQGIDLVYGSWRSILAPRGITPEHIAFWEGTLRRASESAEWKAELERYFWSDFFVTGAALRKNLDKEYAETRIVLGELGLVRQ
jgi:putative tricarboxylic transport membrane protein